MDMATNDFELRKDFVEQTLRSLINLLPNSYNKETTDTNFYKLLRALAYELADAKFEVNQIKENTYLDTVSPDLIYNNFGVLVKLQKKPEWDDEKYRGLIQGVTKSLLTGPTKQSLIDAFKLFTTFNVNVYELYKDADKVDPSLYLMPDPNDPTKSVYKYNPMFTFVFEVEKPMEDPGDYGSLIQDAQYVINIIKPAHTIGISIITLVGDENYRSYYAIDYKLDNIFDEQLNDKIQNEKNTLANDYFNSLVAQYSESNSVTIDQATDILRLSNNGMSNQDYLDSINAKAKADYDNYLLKFETQPNFINNNDYSVASLTLEHFRLIEEYNTFGNIEQTYLTQLREQAYANGIGEYVASQLDLIITNRAKDLQSTYVNNGGNISDFTIDEWQQKAIESLKDDYYKQYLINQLGNIDTVNTECMDYAMQFEPQLNTFYNLNPYYGGMDSIEVETNNNSVEGIFGWRHISTTGQLKTSLDFNHSKIGGTDLIGPLYIVTDTMHFDSAYGFDETIPISTAFKPFTLNKDSFLDGSVLTAQSQTNDHETEVGVDMAEVYDKNVVELFDGVSEFLPEETYVMAPDLTIDEVDIGEMIFGQNAAEAVNIQNSTIEDHDTEMIRNEDVSSKLKATNDNIYTNYSELHNYDSFIFTSQMELFQLNNQDSNLNETTNSAGLVKVDEHIESQYDFQEPVNGFIAPDYQFFRLGVDSLDNRFRILGPYTTITTSAYLSKVDAQGNETLIETRTIL